MTSPRPAPTRSNGVQTRERILESAKSCFCRFGYGGVSISEIARAAKMSKAKVTYHFQNTDQVLVELAKRWGESGRSVTLEYLASQNLSSAESRVLAMADGMFEWMKRDPESARLTPTLLQAVRANVRVRRIVQNTLDTGAVRIKLLISQSSIARGMKDREMEKRARAIHGVMIGGALYVISMNAWENIELYQATTHEGIRHLLAASGECF